MPARRAASSLRPIARSLRPKVERCSTMAVTSASTRQMTRPMCSGDEGSPVRLGSLTESGIGSDSGSVAELVCGWRSSAVDWTHQYTVSRATKPSSRVLITSLVPKRTFMNPAMPPQKAPASVPPSSGTITARPSGRPATGGHRPSAVAAMPPTAIWPSPPTLVRLARNARMKPRPTSASATARLIEAPMAKALPKAPSRKASIASGTDLPLDRDQQQADDHRAGDGEERHGDADQAAAVGQREGQRRHAASPAGIWPDIRAPIAAALGHPGGALADQPAAVEHDDPVGDGDQLVELARDQQHADAAPGGGADLAIDRLDGADVEAARRLGGDQRDQRIERQLARQHGLLLVAAAQARKGDLRPGGADVEGAHLGQRRLVHGAALQQAEAGEPAELVQEHVLRHRHAGDAGDGVAVLRHDAAARRRDRRGAAHG